MRRGKPLKGCSVGRLSRRAKAIGRQAKAASQGGKLDLARNTRRRGGPTEALAVIVPAWRPDDKVGLATVGATNRFSISNSSRKRPILDTIPIRFSTRYRGDQEAVYRPATAVSCSFEKN